MDLMNLKKKIPCIIVNQRNIQQAKIINTLLNINTNNSQEENLI